ncbi:MAG: hypothetical protein Fur0012_07530 [Elusimicrobiota bacterium]
MTVFYFQMDYIFFVYGLSFVLLGALCLLLSKNREDGLRWDWLSIFAFAHGFNEWMDMLAVTFSDNFLFQILRVFILCLSFIFMFEFAIRSWQLDRDNTHIKFYILPSVFTLFFFLMHGIAGGSAAARYFFALPSAVMAGLAVTTKKTGGGDEDSMLLKSMGILILIYAFFAGAITPAASFTPALYLNYDNFLNLTGLPVQLIRALLASFMALIAWLLYIKSHAAGIKIYKKKRTGIILAALIITTIFLGWFFVNYTGNMALKSAKEESENIEKALSGTIKDYTRLAEGAAKSIAGSPWIEGIDLSDKAALTKANMVLDRYLHSFNLSVCYLMDRNGTVKASSNRKSYDSFVGKNYSFRPYFKHAISGKIGRYFAKGVTSKEKGFYCAMPLLKSGKVVGAVSVKINLSNIYEAFNVSENSFLVSPEGIIFFSTKSELEGRTLWPVSDIKLKEIENSKQLGEILYSPILNTEAKDDDLIFFQGQKSYVSRSFLGDSGWSVIIFHSLSKERIMRFLVITLIMFFCIIFIVFFISIMKSETARENAEAMLELSRKVETLEGILPICANCKKIRDDKGYWNRVESYISKHSKAVFSHSLCPECLKKFYPEFANRDSNKTQDSKDS